MAYIILHEELSSNFQLTFETHSNILFLNKTVTKSIYITYLKYKDWHFQQHFLC